MPTIYKFPMPIPVSNLLRIQDMIRNAGLLTIFDSSLDSADASLYRLQVAKSKTECRALIDLNVLKDILSVARQGDKRSPEARRLGAALIAFCQCADVAIEPSIALHESPKDWRAELRLFRSIDNAETTDLAKVAFGEIEQIPERLLPEIPFDDLPDEMPDRLHGHAALQTAMFKIALIGRSSDSVFKKLEQFMNWSFHEYLFSREAVHLALFHLTGNSPNPILKKTKVRSPDDRMSALDNAVWDLMLVRTWVEYVAEQKDRNRIWILCTRDKGLQRLAREMMIANAGDGDVATQIESMFTRAAGKDHAAKLYKQYQDFMRRTDEPSRPSNQPGFDEYCEHLNASLRSEYLNDSIS